MLKKNIRIILLMLAIIVGTSSCAERFRLNPEGFLALSKDIRTEYPFITLMSMEYIGTPNDIDIYINFNEEKSLDEVEVIKEKIIQYYASDDFYQSIYNDDRIQVKSKEAFYTYFRFAIDMKATSRGGYHFSCRSFDNTPIDVGNPNRWRVTVRDLAYRKGWPTAKKGD